MSHNIQERDIQTGINMAWHKKTNVVEVINNDNCGILYPMTIVPIYFDINGTQVPANGRQIVSLDDNMPVGKVVGDDYKLMANTEIWEAIQKGLDGTKNEIVSCGTVNNRSLGFVSIKISDDIIAAGRETKSTLNVMWGHGGNKSVMAKTGLTVIVCQNTFNMAMQAKSDFSLSIRHTANSNVMDLSKAIDTHIGVTAEFKNAMDMFATVDVTEDTARKIYAGTVIGKSVIPEKLTGKTRLTNTVNDLTTLFTTGAGNAGKNMADVWNGFTDYYTHQSSGGENRWKQFVSSEFGSSSVKKQEFYDILTDSNRLDKVITRGEEVLTAINL